MGKKKNSKKNKKKKSPGFFSRNCDLIRNVFSYLVFFFILGIGMYIYYTPEERLTGTRTARRENWEKLDVQQKMAVLVDLINESKQDPEELLENMTLLIKESSGEDMDKIEHIFVKSNVMFYFVDFMQNDTSLRIRELSTTIVTLMLLTNPTEDKLTELMKYDLLRIYVDLLFQDKKSEKIQKCSLSVLTYLTEVPRFLLEIYEKKDHFLEHIMDDISTHEDPLEMSELLLKMTEKTKNIHLHIRPKKLLERIITMMEKDDIKNDLLENLLWSTTYISAELRDEIPTEISPKKMKIFLHLLTHENVEISYPTAIAISHFVNPKKFGEKVVDELLKNDLLKKIKECLKVKKMKNVLVMVLVNLSFISELCDEIVKMEFVDKILEYYDSEDTRVEERFFAVILIVNLVKEAKSLEYFIERKIDKLLCDGLMKASNEQMMSYLQGLTSFVRDGIELSKECMVKVTEISIDGDVVEDIKKQANVIVQKIQKN